MGAALVTTTSRAAAAVGPVAEPDRVLVLAYGHISDTMAALPALRSLRHAWANARIDVLVVAAAAPLLRRCPYVDELITWSDFRHKGTRIARVEKAATVSALGARLRLRRYTVTVVLHHSTGAMRMLSNLIGSPVRAGIFGPGGSYTHPADPPEGIESARQENARVLAALGISADGGPVELWTSAAAVDAAAELLAETSRPMVGIHPGSDWSCQQWLPARFAAVGDQVHRDTGAAIVLSGSASEVQLQNEITLEMTTPALRLASRTSFEELVEVIRSLDLLISVNSAAASIADAVGTPSLILLGPEDGRHTGVAAGARRRVLQPGGRLAPGSWCELSRWGVLSGCESPMCRGVAGLDQLTADRVAGEAIEMLASSGQEQPIDRPATARQ